MNRLLKTFAAATVLLAGFAGSAAQADVTKTMKRAAADLIWSASSKASREERAEVIRRLPPLLKTLRDGMSHSGLATDKQDEHVRQLNNALAAAFTAKTAAIPRERLDELMDQLETLEAMLPQGEGEEEQVIRGALSFVHQGLGTAVLDGREDDEVWRTTPATRGFRQFEPGEDVPPSFETEFKIAYDDRNLYVLVRAFDPHPDSIAPLLSRRDVKTQSDQLKIIVDGFLDRHRRAGTELAPVEVRHHLTAQPDGVELVVRRQGVLVFLVGPQLGAGRFGDDVLGNDPPFGAEADLGSPGVTPRRNGEDRGLVGVF